MTQKDRIEEIWNSNKNIPFMQSKEILRYGYTCGNNDCREENLNKPAIKQSDNNEQKTFSRTIKNKEKTIKLAKIELLEDIISYTKKHPNFLDVLDYVEKQYTTLKTETE